MYGHDAGGLCAVAFMVGRQWCLRSSRIPEGAHRLAAGPAAHLDAQPATTDATGIATMRLVSPRPLHSTDACPEAANVWVTVNGIVWNR